MNKKKQKNRVTKKKG